MLKIKFVKSVEEIPFYKKSYDYFSCPLFHGTRRHMLEMSDEDRASHFKMCDKLVRYTQEIANDIPEEVLNKYINDMLSQGLDTYIGSYSLFDAYGKTSMYEYGNFYMSFCIDTAMRYSKNSGGELSRFAYDCAHMLTTLGLDIPEDIKPAVDLILDYYEKYKNDERLIIVLTKVDFIDLVLEGGTPFSSYCSNQEVLIEEIDHLFDYYHIDENGIHTFQQGYRILNPDKYQMYAFPFEMVDDVIKKVSNIVYKKYFEEGLRLLRKNKGINIHPHDYFHDEINEDGSFIIEFEIWGKHLGNELVFPVTFYQNDFVKERIPLDDEASLPNTLDSNARLSLRVAFRIFNAYKTIKNIK